MIVLEIDRAGARRAPQNFLKTYYNDCRTSLKNSPTQQTSLIAGTRSKTSQQTSIPATAPHRTAPYRAAVAMLFLSCSRSCPRSAMDVHSAYSLILLVPCHLPCTRRGVPIVVGVCDTSNGGFLFCGARRAPAPSISRTVATHCRERRPHYGVFIDLCVVVERWACIGTSYGTLCWSAIIGKSTADWRH
jgi:hypothetical protein